MDEKILKTEEIELEILKEVYQIIKEINKELSMNRGEHDFFSIEQILIHRTPNELREILLDNSSIFNELCTNSKYKKIVFIINNYIEKIYEHYDKILFSEQNKFDQYVSFSKNDSPGKKSYEQNDLEMDLHKISNTIGLMNEAIRLWYEVYSDKVIISEFSDGEILKFKIKEGELAHLFGIVWKSLKNNEGLKKMGIVIPDTELTDAEKYDILLKITEIYDNGNILQYEEDRLKKLLDTKRIYKIAEMDKKFDFLKKDKSLLPYPKINVRTKAFIDYRPLERLSLLLDFKAGERIIQHDKSDVKNTILLSQNNYSDKFNWTGIVSTKDYKKNQNYMRSILLNTPEEYENYMKKLYEKDSDGNPLAKESITTKILVESDYGGSGGVRIFSEEEQIKFIQDVLLDFNTISFERIIDYYQELINRNKNTKRK